MTFSIERFWKWFLLLAWLYLAVPVMVPGQFWYTIHDITIESKPLGDTPKATIDRTIHRRFSGTWFSTLYRVFPDGHVEVVPRCTREIPITIEPGQELPDEITLASMISATCPLRPGTFQVRGILTINPERFFPTKRLPFRSNTFKILEN